VAFLSEISTKVFHPVPFSLKPEKGCQKNLPSRKKRQKRPETAEKTWGPFCLKGTQEQQGSTGSRLEGSYRSAQ